MQKTNVKKLLSHLTHVWFSIVAVYKYSRTPNANNNDDDCRHWTNIVLRREL